MLPDIDFYIKINNEHILFIPWDIGSISPRPESPTFVSQYRSNVGPTLNSVSGVEITFKKASRINIHVIYLV